MYFKNLNWPKRNESAISETSIGYKTELLKKLTTNLRTSCHKIMEGKIDSVIRLEKNQILIELSGYIILRTFTPSSGYKILRKLTPCSGYKMLRELTLSSGYKILRKLTPSLGYEVLKKLTPSSGFTVQYQELTPSSVYKILKN